MTMLFGIMEILKLIWYKYFVLILRSFTMKSEHFENLQLAPKGEGQEKRIDWLMRQFVDNIREKLSRGKIDWAEARRLMTDRGVPMHVQLKLAGIT